MAFLKAADRERSMPIFRTTQFEGVMVYTFETAFLKCCNVQTFQTRTNQKVVKVTFRFEILALMATFGHHFAFAFFVQPDFCQRRHDDSRSCSTKFEPRGLSNVGKVVVNQMFFFKCLPRKWKKMKPIDTEMAASNVEIFV